MENDDELWLTEDVSKFLSDNSSENNNKTNSGGIKRTQKRDNDFWSSNPPLPNHKSKKKSTSEHSTFQLSDSTTPYSNQSPNINSHEFTWDTEEPKPKTTFQLPSIPPNSYLSNPKQSNMQQANDLLSEDKAFNDFYDPPKKSNKKRYLILSFVFIILLAAFAFYWVNKNVYSGNAQGENVIVNIPAGATTGEISEILANQDVIKNSSAFKYWIRVRDNDAIVQAGTYNFNKNTSVPEVINILKQGPNANTIVTIPEGLWVSEILTILDQTFPNITRQELEEVLNSNQIKSSIQPKENLKCPELSPNCKWEGLLYPTQYQFSNDASALEILTKMNDEFNKSALEVGLLDKNKLNGRDPYDLLIIASLIESEAAVSDDTAKISEVIQYRYSGKDPANSWLGIDATVIYSLGVRNPGDNTIVERHKDPNDPYNTSALGGSETRARLPQTPICAVGIKSLEAALNPSNEGYKWYALADPKSKSHVFSKTKEEHDLADAQYDKIKSANQ